MVKNYHFSTAMTLLSLKEMKVFPCCGLRRRIPNVAPERSIKNLNLKLTFIIYKQVQSNMSKKSRTFGKFVADCSQICKRDSSLPIIL